MAKGLSRMKGNLHVRFLGGWRVVTLSGYPVGVIETNGTGGAQRSRCLPLCPLGGGWWGHRSLCRSGSCVPTTGGRKQSPGSPASSGGSPAATLHQLPH